MPQLLSPLTYDGAYNAKAYGAKGDNTTNDSPAIQAAMDAAGDAGGGVVIIPPGNYRLNAQLEPASNTTVIANGAYLWSGAGNYLLVSNVSGATGFGGGQNIHVQGGIWDGKAQDAAADAAYNVIGFYHCRNVSVRDAIIRNVASWHGLEFNSSDGCIADNVRFEGFVDTTTAQSRQFSAAIQIDLATNDSTCSKNVTVQNCYVGPAVDGSGNGSFGRGFDSHTDALGFWYTGIRIVNNVIESTIQEGIQTYSWNDSVVSGNVIKSPGKAGIKVAGNAANDVRNLTITNNVVNSPGENGIYLAPVGTRLITNSTISGNVVDNAGTVTGQPAIYLQYSQSCTISSNSVYGGSNIGIALVSCNNSTISGNVITDAGHDGIRVGETSGALVSNNRIMNPAQFGVYILGNSSTNNAVVGNFVYGAGQNNSTGDGTGTTDLRNSAAALGVRYTGGGGNSFIGNRCIKGTARVDGGTTYIAAWGIKAEVTGSGGAGNISLIGNSIAGWADASHSIQIGRTMIDDFSTSTSNQWEA